MNYAPLKPVVSTAETDDDDEMLSFVDPSIGPVKKKDYYKALIAASKRRRLHYTNPLFKRHPKDFWIDGQNALRSATSWTGKTITAFAKENWLPDEYVRYDARIYEKYADAWSRWQAWQNKLKAVRLKIKEQLHAKYPTKYYKRTLIRAAPIGDYDIVKRTSAQVTGRARAETYGVLLKFKKTAPATADEHAWDMRFRNGMELAHCPQFDRWFLEKHFPHVYHARLPETSKVRSLARVLNWISDYQSGKMGIRGEEMLDAAVHKTASHFLHQSVDEPTMVAYAPSYAYFKQDRWVRTTFGRYLNKFFGHVLDEKQIRDAANKWTIAMTPPTLNFVGNDDPAKWEWVYENSSSFKSCMTANRTDRYIHQDVMKIMHPVRLYANPKNDLVLAWLGVDKDGGVAARCIVNTKKKTYLRVYGDDRLRIMLHKEGYIEDRTYTLTNSVFDAIRVYPDADDDRGNLYIAPYLDGGAVRHVRIDDRPYLKIVNDQPCFSPQSNAIVRVVITVRKVCSCCKSVHDLPEGKEYSDGTMWRLLDYDICSSCLRKEGYRFAWVTPEVQDWLPMNLVYFDDYFDRYILNDPAIMQALGMIEYKGAWRHKDELEFLPVDEIYVDKKEIYSLSYRIRRNGRIQKWTLKSNAARDVNGEWYDVRYSATCVFTGLVTAESQFFYLGPDRTPIHQSVLFNTSKGSVDASRKLTVTDVVEKDGLYTATVVMHDTPQSENLLAEFLSDHLYTDTGVAVLRNLDMSLLLDRMGYGDIKWYVQDHYNRIVTTLVLERRAAAAAQKAA